MKDNPRDLENLLLCQTLRNHGITTRSTLQKLMLCFLLFLSVGYLFHALKFVYPSHSSNHHLLNYTHTQISNSSSLITEADISPSGSVQIPITKEKTELRHIVFGIAASAKLWNQRKNYIKLWWRPHEMRGVVWLDEAVKNDTNCDSSASADAHCMFDKMGNTISWNRGKDDSLPLLKISSDTSKFKYNNPKGHRSAIRISRIISDTLRLGMKDVRWFVMGDDDTVFVPDNLVRVLRKYDHNQFYYMGSSSESHLQNIKFSYGMAYGGGGFSISYPLAKALAKMQDRCLQRYPGLYGSDDRIHACMAELGVPLTKEPGFHQYDVYGNLFGLLASHPVAPLVSLHHLDLVEPIFPNMDRVQALDQLKVPMKLDSAGLMQQSICYDRSRVWTVSISWGYAVQIFRGILSPREVELPSRTFLNWHRRADYTGYSFNTRPFSRNACQKPFLYFLSNAIYNVDTNKTASEYVRHDVPNPECNWKMEDPSSVHIVEVHKRPDPYLWDKSPRRNCCRILPTKKEGAMVIDVGACREEEIIELQ